MNAELRERALAQHHLAKHEHLSRGTKHLLPLLEGDTVLVQNQSSPKPGKWTKTGKIVEVQDFDSYLIKIDGSNHITKRNRRFLRKIVPYIEKSAGSSETPKPNLCHPVGQHPGMTGTQEERRCWKGFMAGVVEKVYEICAKHPNQDLTSVIVRGVGKVLMVLTKSSVGCTPSAVIVNPRY